MQSGSKPLGEKLSTLVNPSLSTHAVGQMPVLGLRSTADEGTLASTIAPQLWQYMQKTIRQKPTTCLQSFVATDSLSAPPVESEQWLGDPSQPNWDDLKTRPGGVGPIGDGASGVYHIREGHYAPQAAFQEVLFPRNALDVMPTPSSDNSVKTADDEMLLGDTVVEPLVLATCPSDKFL